MTLLNDLKLYYKLDDNAANTTVTDEQGNQNGTSARNTSIITSAGKVGTSFLFSKANSDMVNLGQPSELDFGSSTDFTISCWINTTDDGTTGDFIFCTGRGSNEWVGFQQYNDFIYPYIDDGTNTAGGSGDDSIAQGGWHHILVTYDRDGDMTLYVDGVNDGSWDISGVGDIDNSEDTYIGNRDGGNHFFDGYIDEVGIWHRVLTATEIASLYNSGDGLSYDDFGTNTQINIGDDWKAIAAMQINIGDTWKAVEGAQINIGDTWKTIF